MPTLEIGYLGTTGQRVYCSLFLEDENIALHSGLQTFSIFSHTAMNQYAWYMTENTGVRPGYYQSIDFSSLISEAYPITVEIREQVAASSNYTSDILKATSSFVWNGQSHVDDHVIPLLLPGTYIGFFNYNDTIRAELHFKNEYGLLTTNTEGFNFHVLNPSGQLVATGSWIYNFANYPCFLASFQASGDGFIAGGYRLQTSGTYDGFKLATTHYFNVSTGTTTSVNVNVDVITQLGYATGSVNDASATTTSFVTTLASTVDNFYNGQILRFTTGSLIGQGRIISDYNGTTKAVTLNKAFSATPSNGSNLLIYPIGGELNV